MSALLAFHLGPVQPFIAQARKTRDLWVGSYLLSALMREALRDYPGTLLFPALDAYPLHSPDHPGKDSVKDSVKDGVADLPNKFIAQHASIDGAKQAAERTQRRIEETWENLATRVWNYLFPDERDAQLRAIWERQTSASALFEFYWAAVPYDEHDHVPDNVPDNVPELRTSGGASAPGAPSAYSSAYQRVQRLLDARKRLRAFAASDEPGEKSSISGERQALYPASSDPQNFWRTVARPFHEAQISHLGHEKLDAIDTIKRFASFAPGALVPNAPFPSTYTLAAAPFLFAILQRLQAPAQTSNQAPTLDEQQAVRNLAAAAEAWASCSTYDQAATFAAIPALNALATDELPRRLLRGTAGAVYPSSYSERQLADVGVDKTTIDTLLKKGPAALKTFKRAATSVGIAPPASYFAVLLLDGDRMGRLISRQRTPHDHHQLSRALSTFAHTHPRDIVEGNSGLGRLVYAGGDDVMAFLPVAHALDAAVRLRTAYGEALREIAPDATASAGIVFAHRHMPLGIILEQARAAENAAKERYGRDALSVTILRRSGNLTSVGAHWNYAISPTAATSAADTQRDGPSILDPVRIILAVRDHLLQGDLSPRFVYTLVEEAPTLAALHEEARRTEIKRLLMRQRAGGARARFPNDAVESLSGDLAALSVAFDHTPPDDGATDTTYTSDTTDAGYSLTDAGPRRGLVELSGWLLVAAFLARSEAGSDEGGDEA